MQPTDQCEKWLKVAANLRVDRKDNIAPHKPLLLLVVAELVHELDADGKQLLVIKRTDHTPEKVLTLYAIQSVITTCAC